MVFIVSLLAVGASSLRRGVLQTLLVGVGCEGGMGLLSGLDGRVPGWPR
jgi:hypothetical protein